MSQHISLSHSYSKPPSDPAEFARRLVWELKMTDAYYMWPDDNEDEGEE